MISSARYYGEVAYRREKAICDYRERDRVFDRPSYMTKEPTVFPKAEKGLCCPNQNSAFHFLFHFTL